MSPASTMNGQILRAAGLFQAILMVPIAFILGLRAFVELWDNYESIYLFLTFTINGLVATIILFILLLQNQLTTIPTNITLLLEATKSALATCMWLWLLLDSLLVDHWDGHRDSSNGVLIRVVRSLITGLALLVLFYPTAAYAAYAAREEKRAAARGEGDSERAPLLSREE